MILPPLSSEQIKKALLNKAVHYLQQFTSTNARLEQILRRFAERNLPQAEDAEMTTAIAEVISSCKRYGYLDDRAFAESKIRLGRRAGHSRKHLFAKLLQYGIDPQLIKAVLSDVEQNQEQDERSCELVAALIYIRKKRLGPYAPLLPLGDELRQKHFARLARAGYSLDIAKQVTGLSGVDEAEELAANLAEAKL